MGNLFGMVGTNDMSANRTVGSWREGIIMIEPNGDAMLTAIQAASKKAKPMIGTLHTWFERQRETDFVEPTAVYSNQALSSVYTPGAGVAGAIVYFKLPSENDADAFRVYDRVVMGVGNDISQDENGQVVAVEKNGASSYVAIKLDTDDDATGAFTNLTIVASSFSEGSSRPEAMSTTPREFQTRSQIIKEAIEMTRTEMTISKRKGIRTGDAWAQAEDDALIRWGARLDRTALWERLSTGTGANRQRKSTMLGIRDFLQTYHLEADGVTAIGDGNAGQLSNIFNPIVDTDYAGQTWAEYGGDWLTKLIRILKRYGAGWGELLVLAGDEFFADVEKLALTSGQFTLAEAQEGYGIDLRKWITNNGTVYLHNYAAFNHNPRYRKAALWYYPKACQYMYVDDVDLKDGKTDPTIDGDAKQWVGECCFEWASPWLFGISYNSGMDSTVQ